MIDQKREGKPDRGPARPGGSGFDPRLLGLAAVLLVIGLAVLLAYVMNSVNHADLCLAAGGRNCG